MRIEKPFKAFKDARIIVSVLYRFPDITRYSIDTILSIIQNDSNTWLVLINNAGDPDISNYIASISHPRCITFELPFNFGKALAANFFFREYINETNIPKTVVSLDPDTVFSKESYTALVNAVEHLPQCGMIGMRFTKNNCNPERNLFFGPKTIKDKQGTQYQITCPFMCTVAGPVLAVAGQKIWKECKNELFPKKFIKVYGGDDSALYNALRWKYINGYLEGTEATHLVSGVKRAPEFENRLKH